ncbi:MAG: tRNA (adenine(22)-N(1))-methyltransferase [Syntrophomonadaceae bacterium]|nr:tRNA (adenine(22)-N(1))-methyltransferase [Bacillota bacterium]
MKLTPRLQAMAELIPPGSIVADIGTDHAYLPVYLVLNKISRRVVAVDLNQAPLQQAKETVAAFNCLQEVDLRLGNGLHAIKEADKIDTVVIAGLGGKSIAAILRDGRHALKGVQQLILQPMSEEGDLRLFLARNGFALVHETLAQEGRRFYEIILAKAGQEQETDLFRLSFGPRLLEQKPPLLSVFLEEKIRKLKSIYHSLQRAEKDDVSRKLQEVEREIYCLEEVLTDVAAGTDLD